MAATITITDILDSPLNTVFRVNIIGDGAGDITGSVIYDPANYVNTGVSKRIMYVKYCLNGFNAELRWDNASTGKQIIAMEKEHYSEQDFEDEYGLNNNAISGRTGKITISTNGLGSNKVGYLILSIKSSDVMPGVA